MEPLDAAQRNALTWVANYLSNQRDAVMGALVDGMGMDVEEALLCAFEIPTELLWIARNARIECDGREE